MKTSNKDRISNLPDNLLQHILSFLDMKYVTRTRVLSTRWRYVWETLPILNFDSRTFTNTERFMKFMERTLLLRDNTSNVNKFHLWVYHIERVLENRVPCWIAAAMPDNFRELHLTIDATFDDEFDYKGLLVLPCSLFVSNTLQTLIIRIPSLGHDLFLPRRINFPSLRILELSGLYFVPGDILTVFLSNAPLLYSLSVNKCGLSFVGEENEYTMNAPSNLKHLSLEFTVENCDFDDLESYKININAPNLTSFKCEGPSLVDYHLKNSSSIDKADIHIPMLDCSGYGPEDEPLVARKRKLFRDCVMRCLNGVSIAKELSLSALFLEFWSELTVKGMLKQFSNLKHLKLKTSLTLDSIRTVMHLLKISPNLETLLLVLTWDPYNYQFQKKCIFGDEVMSGSTYVEECSKTRLSSKCMLHHLKVVKMQGVLRFANELIFLEILLESALVLEKLVLFASRTEVYDRERRLKELSEKLVAFPRESPNLSILFIQVILVESTELYILIFTYV